VSKKRRGRESKYTDAFKRQLVAESHSAGATVPIVSKQHGVPTSRIYSWRGDARFQPRDFQTPDFTPVEVTFAPALEEIAPPRSDARIEIMLENGRKLSISDGVDAGFVLELARGLAA
jgi:transposase